VAVQERMVRFLRKKKDGEKNIFVLKHKSIKIKINIFLR
jgi:hypothetical protein